MHFTTRGENTNGFPFVSVLEKDGISESYTVIPGEQSVCLHHEGSMIGVHCQLDICGGHMQSYAVQFERIVNESK